MADAGNWMSRLGAVLTIAGPPVVVAGVWRSFVSTHPMLAIVLLVIYEAMVTILRLSGQVAGDLRDRWRPQLVDYLDKAVRRHVSRFDTRYRELVLQNEKYIDQKGLETVGFYTPQLDEVFVDVALTFQAAHLVPTGLVTEQPADSTRRMSIMTFLDHPQPAVLAVVGRPGSGKTTLLRHVTRQVCLGGRGRRRTLPILLYLRDHAAAINADFNIGPADLVCRWLRQLNVDVPKGWFEQQLRRGNCVVLFDGLDEVASQHERRAVADWVARQTAANLKNDYVITSRPHGFRTAPVHEATVLNTLPFSDKQVATFIRRWYGAVERHAGAPAGDDGAARAETAAEDLLERLRGAPALAELTGNPLLLTMIVNVHRYRGVLPGSRVKLYREICQVMLGLRQEAKKLALDLDADHKEMLLRGLAFTMMRRRVSALPTAEVISELRPALGRVSRTLTAEQFLADASSNGLLVERESDQYSFAHLTFQEFLAAMHIRANHRLTALLTDAVADPWWRETILLFTAQSDADQIVRACLQDGSASALALAFDCTEGGSELAPELRDYLDNLLASVFAPATATDLRRLMAGMLATRQLGRTARVGASSVCVKPVSAGLYWLFLQDCPGHEPDRGTAARPELGADAVTGVRADDATAFVRWVNEITGNRVSYRLPTVVELHHSDIRKADPRMTEGRPLTAWRTDPATVEPQLWVPPDTTSPHQIDGRAVADALARDLRQWPASTTRLLLVHAVAANQVLRFGLARTRQMARSLGRTDLPKLDTTLTIAKQRSGSIGHALKRCTTVERLLATVDTSRQLGAEDAFRLARLLDVSLGNVYSMTNTLEFPDKLDDETVGMFAKLVHRARIGEPSLLDQVLALDRAWSLDFDEVFDAAAVESATSLHSALTLNAFAGLEQCVGSALGYALASTIRQPHLSAAQWATGFTNTLAELTGIAGDGRTPYVVAPGALADKVKDAWRRIRGTAELAKRPWVYLVATNLHELALPVLRREQPAPTGWAGAIRLAALCLGTEADSANEQFLAALLREIAAGVTILERRQSGELPATETIVLARS